MAGYHVQTAPYAVATTDGKVILEHYGRMATRDHGLSVAHMISPPGWGEPAQTPDFDEVTIVVRGRKRVQVDGKAIDLEPGQTILIRRGTRVRYSNPFAEECEYWAICTPAFSLGAANREAANTVGDND